MVFYLKLPEMRLFWYIVLLTLFFLFFEFEGAYLQLNFFWMALINIVFFTAVGVIVFITSLRLAAFNQEVKIERNELKSVIANLGNGVVAYDHNFKVLIFNSAAERIFNLRSGEMEGNYFAPDKVRDPRFSFFCRVLFPSLAPQVVRITEEGKYPQIIDMSFENPRLELRVATDRVIDSDGRVLGFMKIIQDRTREAELLRSKSEFIEVAAHQLRTPLTSVNWIFESLVKEKLSEEQKNMVDMGAIAAGSLLKIVNDLLDIAQIEEGKFGYKFESVDFVRFMEEVLIEMNVLAKSLGVKLYFKRPAEALPPLTIDAKKISVVLSNLIANSIKYNVENGEAVVGVRKLEDKPYVEVSVKDTGIGIAEEDAGKVFTKFFRSDNAQKAVPDGTGLGLYIVKNIIRRHGGEIRFDSQLNRGTTFYFTLPLDPSLIPQKEFAYED